MTIPESTEITEKKAKTNRRNRQATTSRHTEAPAQALRNKPGHAQKADAPALAPDCEDGPIRRTAKRLAAADPGRLNRAPESGIAADPNAGLIDELERILRGDLSAEPKTDRPPRFPSFGDDPLSFLNPDSDDDEDDEPDEPVGLAERQPTRRFPFAPELDDPADDLREPIEAKQHQPTDVHRVRELFEDERDGFDFFDEEPPRTAEFWRSDNDLPPAALGRRRRGISRGFLTVSALVLLVASGGVYSAVQFSAEPNAPAAGSPNLAAASPLASPALPPPVLVETTTEPAPVVEAPLPADGLGAAIGVAEPPAETPTEPAAEAAPGPLADAAAEPRIVPLFRTPEGEAAPEPAATEPPLAADAGAAAPVAETPAPAAEAAEPAANAAPPPPPAPPAVVADTRPARINDWVNLRASASMGARVLEVIPLGATVELIGCPGWCEVVYEGIRGFVGPDFVDPL